MLSGDPVIDGNSNFMTYNVTITITLKGRPGSNVQTQISLLDDSAIVITVDSILTNKHFGSTQIYGTQHLICVEVPDLCK
jgi:hypothetical protein